MKRVLLLGATGTAGRAIAERLLSDTDNCITLFARRARDVCSDSARTTVVNGNAENLADLRRVMEGQDVVYCAISGAALPGIAENILSAMAEYRGKRLIFMGAVGIYNEIPEDLDGQDNLDREPEQIPNREAADRVEASRVNYTVLRPGYLREGAEDDFVLTGKGEPAKGYVTTIPSLIKLAVRLIQDETLYTRESVSITRDMTRERGSSKP